MKDNADYWQKRSQEITFCTDAFIGGEYRPPLTGSRFDSIDPATNTVIARVASCGAADVDDAVDAARATFREGRWSNLALEKRKSALLRLAKLIRDHSEELALTESMDMGKPVRDALAIDVPGTAEAFAWYAEAIDKVYGEVAPTTPSALGLVTREPVGVVGAVTPWNFPLLMSSWKVAPALAAGNSVVMKPSERASLSCLRLAGLAAEAGIPPGVFNVVPGTGEAAGRALGLHHDVDCLTFTGSNPVGALFLTYAAQSNLKQVSLETGGKSAQIVFADCADIDRAACAVAMGIFFNQGEVCNAGSRLLVEASIKERMLSAIVAHAGNMQPGDPLDPKTRMGALVDEAHCQSVMEFIASGCAEGARLVAGGHRVSVNGKGCYVQPTVFDGVTAEMRIAREEIFGPVLSIASFSTEEEAVTLANDSRYGLAAGVWTSNLDRAHRVSRNLQAGTVWVNCFDVASMTVPFGGVKQSGFGGRDRSLHALQKYTQLKTTWVRLAR